MDPKAKMPDIKSDVNKVDDGKKKKAGGLLGLFGGGGGGAAGGLGGLGAGGAGMGGLLATKAGMVALLVVGSAVAGGIGLAGYKMFGPGDADKAGGNLSLFAPRPQQAATEGAAPAAGDGASASLSMMAQSAAKDKAAEDAEAAASASAAAPTDNAAGSAAADAEAADAARRAAAASADGALNSGGGAGAIGSMGRGLANVKKLGVLSSASGGGASTTAGSGSGRLGDNLAHATKNGATSAFASGGPGAKSSSSNRGIASGRGRSARAQARNVMGDQGGGKAGSSFAAGKTYDGSATQSGGAIGPDGGAIGMGGVGDGGTTQPKSLAANSIHDKNELTPAPAKEKVMVVPWAQACQRAMMLTMLAAALAYAASKLPIGPWTKMAQMIIGGIIMMIGAYIGVLAGQVMSGPYGQKMQGMTVAAASLGVIVTGLGVIMGASKTTDKTAGKPGTNGLGNLMANPMILLGGGAAIVAGIGLMLLPKPKPVELKEGEPRPDVRYEARPNPVRYTV